MKAGVAATESCGTAGAHCLGLRVANGRSVDTAEERKLVLPAACAPLSAKSKNRRDRRTAGGGAAARPVCAGKPVKLWPWSVHP